MNCKSWYRRFSVMLLAGICTVPLLSSAVHAQSFGINWQGYAADYGLGAFSVSGFGSAFGVDADDWYESQSAASTFDANASNGSVSFSSPSMQGGTANLAWSGSVENLARVVFSPGWAHANDSGASPPNQPHSGEEAVLTGWLFSNLNGAGEGWTIDVQVSGLDDIATHAGVPLAYQVKLIASSDWGWFEPERILGFQPADVSDNDGNSETLNFGLLDLDNSGTFDQPDFWNSGGGHGKSFGGAADSTETFTGDTLSISIAGPNFPSWDPMSRSSLAGVVINFVTPSIPGDFNSDGNVDGADFVAWQTHFPTGSDATLEDGDADGNGTVDGADFVIWQTHFPYPPSPGQAQSVPEPSSVFLALCSSVVAAGIWSLRRIRVNLRKSIAPAAAVLAMVAMGMGTAEQANAQSFGVHWTSGWDGCGPYSIDADFGSAYGIAGADWYDADNPKSSSVTGDTLGYQFSSPSMSGATASIYWNSANIWYSNSTPGWAWSHYQENTVTPESGVTPGLPTNGDEAALAGSLSSTYESATGLGQKIQVSISGLGAIATNNGVPLTYTVTLLASDNGYPKNAVFPPASNTNPNPGFYVENFSPALVADNASNSETVNFDVLPYHPRWGSDPVLPPDQSFVQVQGPFYGSGATGESSTIFTGDTLNITLDGPYDFGGAWGDSGYGVTSLAGFMINFVNNAAPPGNAVPEPNAIALAVLSAIGLFFARRNFASA
ncbi:MAG: dockerin type I repeat-containing protein [Pirellulales bacterium]|nr:dockerin type I repeat-containing protein [Pirellulales bacterium]